MADAGAGVFLEQSCGRAAKALWCSPGGHTSEGVTESRAAGSGHLCTLRLLTFSLTFRSPVCLYSESNASELCHQLELLGLKGCITVKMNFVHEAKLILKKAINSHCSLFPLSLYGIFFFFFSPCSLMFLHCQPNSCFFLRPLKITVSGIGSHSSFLPPLSMCICKPPAIATNVLFETKLQRCHLLSFSRLCCFPGECSETLGHVCVCVC